MNRSATIAALTVVAVLVAGGTAAALNARVLDATAPTPVGSADSIVPSAAPSSDAAATTPAGAGSPTGVGLTPVPDDSDDAASASPSRTASPRPDSTTRSAKPTRSASSRPSSARPSSSPTDDGGHDDTASPSPSASETNDD